MYDLVIIGGGPAGCSAAVYAARKQLKTLIITPEWGGQSTVSETIFNWVGTKAISGIDLGKNLRDHAESYVGQFLTIKNGEKVTQVSKSDKDYTITTDKDTIQTKTILLCAGANRRKLDTKGADLFEHKGLTYCASCDGPLFSDQDVAVIGGGNAAFETAAQLLAYCKSVTLFNRTDTFKADQITVDKVLAHPKMKALKNVELHEVHGDVFVNGLSYKQSGYADLQTIPVSGIFVEIGLIPNTAMLGELCTKNQIGQLVVDHRKQSTSQAGIWAAGDCTDALYHQNNIAAGDAIKAIEDIYLYLNA